MDKTDEQLICALAENADVSASELSSRLNLSVPAINKRIARLKADGTIRKVTVLTDPRAVGKAVSAFILVKVADFAKSGEFLGRITAEPDVLECCAVSGEYDYLLKLCAPDIDGLENLLLRIKEFGGATSYTMMCLREYKAEATVLP